MVLNSIDKAYFNNSEVDSIYLGDTLIYPSVPPTPPPHDYSQDYLTIRSLEDNNTITFNRANGLGLKDFLWSTDNGIAWRFDPVNYTLNSGDTIIFRCKCDALSYERSSDVDRSYFSSTGRFEVEGNIMTLVDDADPVTGTSYTPTLNAEYVFDGLFFQCTGLTNAENLVLPASTLTRECYGLMFYRCTNLTKAPELPATTLANYCYEYMFEGCRSLTMITCLATYFSATDCTYHWVTNVASSGTFYKNPSMNSWPSGVNGIPSGWTIVNYVE